MTRLVPHYKTIPFPPKILTAWQDKARLHQTYVPDFDQVLSTFLSFTSCGQEDPRPFVSFVPFSGGNNHETDAALHGLQHTL